MGSKHLKERDVTKTFFWADPNRVGVFITQSCSSYSGHNCEKWRKKEIDTSKDWQFIVNNGMILVNENMFFDID
jgi:hypothetical protein